VTARIAPRIAAGAAARSARAGGASILAALIGYLPLATTLVAVVFALALLSRWRAKRGAHLLWWALGVACYGLGTALESTITLRGNSVALARAWYAAGAFLGAWPLAQGTASLLFSRRTALWLTALTLPVVLLAIVLVFLSPVDASALAADRPNARFLLWTAPRALAPLVNVYAALLLVGGAVQSSWRFARTRTAPGRAAGNVLIAVGAILPGIGGSLARHGGVEALYVTEFLGLLTIAAGYALCVRGPGNAPARAAPR
jgi:hypothetical protein